MKKAISLLLALALCLSLTACGKSEAVKSVEAMIDALGEITLESIDAIRSTEDAYNALTEDEQKKVGNYKTLTEARDAYYELAFVGTWYSITLNLNEPEYIFNPRCSVTFYEDMTFLDISQTGQRTTGQWKVDNNQVVLSGITGLSTDFSSYGPSGNCNYTIEHTNGVDYFSNGDGCFYHEDDYLLMLENVVKAVDCSAVELSDVLGFTTFDVQHFDAWGVPTGTSDKRVVLQNLLYNDGWMYFDESDDFLLEVLYPEYTSTFYSNDGSIVTSTTSAGSYNISGLPFSYDNAFLLNTSWVRDDGAVETDISLESLSFGRAKGTLYFINSKYIKDVNKGEHGDRILVLDINEDTCMMFLQIPELYVGPWEEGNLEH